MIGITKWTPIQTDFIPFMSDEWFTFTNRIWYGELEYFFTTLCGLFVSVTICYGYLSEVHEMINSPDEKETNNLDMHSLNPVGEVQSLFLKTVYPELYEVSQKLESSGEKGVQPSKSQPTTDVWFRKRRLKHM